jgi:hypothetical protein
MSKMRTIATTGANARTNVHVPMPGIIPPNA